MRRSALAVVLVATAACTSVDRVSEALSPSPTTRALGAPTGATGSTSGDAAIAIRTPRGGDDIVSPVGISGRAETATGTVVVEILGDDGRELAASLVDVGCGANCRGGFAVDLAFFVDRREDGTVRVFEASAEDGTALHTTDVAVELVPGT